MQDLVVNERLTIPSSELRWRFSRSSGPGGQGVNTTDSRVELLLDLANCSCLGPFRRARLLEHFQARLVEGGLRVVVAEERSQWQNRQKALHRMGELLWKRAAPKPFSSDQGFCFTDRDQVWCRCSLFEASTWWDHPFVPEPGDGWCKTWW